MKFIHSSRTANTYVLQLKGKPPRTIQLLRTSVDEFDFTISQCFVKNYRFSRGYIEVSDYLIKTNINEDISFLSKTLIPVSFEPKNAIEALHRIPHYKRKGFKIPEVTYHSLLNSAFKSNTKRYES